MVLFQKTVPSKYVKVSCCNENRWGVSSGDSAVARQGLPLQVFSDAGDDVQGGYQRVLTAAAGSNIGVMTHGMHREQQAE